MTTEIRMLLYGLAIALIFGAGYWRGYAPEHEKHLKDNATADAFKAQVAADGAKAIKDKSDKEAEYAKNIKAAGDAADTAQHKLDDWMRKHPANSPASRTVPDYPSTSAGTDRAGQICFDRAGFDDAVGRGSAIAAKGQQAVIDRQQLTDGWPR